MTSPLLISRLVFCVAHDSLIQPLTSHHSAAHTIMCLNNKWHAFSLDPSYSSFLLFISYFSSLLSSPFHSSSFLYSLITDIMPQNRTTYSILFYCAVQKFLFFSLFSSLPLFPFLILHFSPDTSSKVAWEFGSWIHLSLCSIRVWNDHIYHSCHPISFHPILPHPTPFLYFT